MAKTAYAFNEPDARALLKVATREQRTSPALRIPPEGLPRPHARISIAWVGGTAITARSGDPPASITAGTGTATLYWIDPEDSVLKPWTDQAGNDVTVTVKNAFSSATQTNVMIGICQDMLGTWWVLSEDCG